MVENQTRTLTGDGIARNTSRSYLTIRGLHRQPFPRSSERGPIEATPNQDGIRRAARYFRAHLSAAPLKRCNPPNPLLPSAHFRAHLSAAPLKRFSAGVTGSKCDDFRAHLSAAPLKQQLKNAQVSLPGTISALI